MDESQKRIDPKILQAILQDDTVRLLKQVLTTLEKQIPRGMVDATEGGEVFSGDRVVPFQTPIFGISITNDGPDSIWVAVNSEAPNRLHEIKITETYKVDMGAAVIKYIFIRVPSGTASIRYPRYY